MPPATPETAHHHVASEESRVGGMQEASSSATSATSTFAAAMTDAQRVTETNAGENESRCEHNETQSLSPTDDDELPSYDGYAASSVPVYALCDEAGAGLEPAVTDSIYFPSSGTSLNDGSRGHLGRGERIIL